MGSLRTLTKAFAQSSHHYNASLPISIDVLEHVGFRRYPLKVGYKEMTTKSMKPLLEVKEPSMVNKNWLLEALANCEDKAKFHTLSSMLLALHEGIVHLPLSIDSRLLLLQWCENQNLNESWVDFYLAYGNLGAV